MSVETRQALAKEQEKLYLGFERVQGKLRKNIKKRIERAARKTLRVVTKVKDTHDKQLHSVPCLPGC